MDKRYEKLEGFAELSDGRRLRVTEVPFPFAMRLARELGNVIGSFPRLGASLLANDVAGLLDTLPAAVMQAGNAAEILILGSTELRQADLQTMRTADALEIIRVAIPLSVTEELLGKVRLAAGALQEALAGARPGGSEPSTA